MLWLACAILVVLVRPAYANFVDEVTVVTVVFADQNGNGVPNIGEHGIPNIPVCFLPETVDQVCTVTDSLGRATGHIPAGRVRFQVQPVPSDKEFVCTNADNGAFGDPDPCGFTVNLSRNNPIVLNFLGLKRVGWLTYFPMFSR